MIRVYVHSTLYFIFMLTFLYVQLKEYVDDTEDYVKIRLDDHQNTLLKFNIELMVSSLVIGMFIVVTGILGMNIDISLFRHGNSRDFWTTVGISSAVSVVLFASIIGWCKYTHFL